MNEIEKRLKWGAGAILLATLALVFTDCAAGNDEGDDWIDSGSDDADADDAAHEAAPSPSAVHDH